SPIPSQLQVISPGTPLQVNLSDPSRKQNRWQMGRKGFNLPPNMAERKTSKTSPRKGRSKSPPRNFEYPDQTEGSRLAAQLREETSKLNAKQRAELFQRGMQIIYGGSAAKEKSGTGH